MTMHEPRRQPDRAAASAGRRIPLIVHDSISMSVKDKRTFPEQLVRILITLLGICGTIWSIQGFFRFPTDPVPLTVFAVGMMFALRLLRRFSPKIGFGMILGSFAFIPAALIKFRDAAIVGAGGIYRIMREKILTQKIAEAEAASAGKWDENDCMRFIFDLLIIAMVALLEYSDVLLSHSQSSRSGFWIRFLVTFPFLECGLYFGLQTSSTAVFMLVCFWIGTLAIARKRPARQTVEVQLNPKATQIQNAFTQETENKYSTHEPAALMLVLAAALLSSAALISTRHFIRSEALNQKRHTIMQAYKDFSLEDLAEFFSRFPGAGRSDTISEEVDLMNSDNPHFDGSTVLNISLGSAATPDDYYMRGIVRTSYTGRGWGVSSDTYRKQQKLLRRLTEENRMPQTIFHSDHVNELRTENGKYPVVHCNINAVKPEQINYLPYQSVFEAGTMYRYDTEIELEDKQSYSLWLMNNAHPDWDMFSLRTSPSEHKTVSEYEAFVDKTYLNVPDTDAMRRVYEEFEPEMPRDTLPLEEKLDMIRAFIWARSDYTISPAPIPQDRDFVEYFITEGHEGYCAHYASAAVLLCRMCGIPARYAQGYVMTTSNFAAGKTEGDYKISIPDNQAHAWAEIYVKGFGWIPYEFTESVTDQWHTPPPATDTVPATTTTNSGISASTTTTTTASAHTTTTKKHETSKVPQSGTTDKTAAQSGSGSGTLRVILRYVLILAALAAVVWLYIRYHRYVLQKRQRAMHGKDPNQAADASFAYLIRLLRLLGIEQQRLTHEDFAKKAEEQCKLLPEGRLTAAVNLQQRVVFSRSGISGEQAAALRKTAVQLAKAIYQQSNPFRRFWLRWGRHLL